MRYLLILFISIFVSQSGFAQQITVKQEMEQIQKEKKVYFIYDARTNLNQVYVGRSLTGLSLDKVLKQLFKDCNIKWKRKGNNIILEQQVKSHIKSKPQKASKTELLHKYTLSGYVYDESGESLVNATIRDKTTGNGTMTNEQGYFSISLPKGVHSLDVAYLGFEEENKILDLNKDYVVKFILHENTTLGEVMVQGDLNSPLLTTQTGKRSFTSKDINTEFSLLSSPDVVKTLQRISGVSSGIELDSGLYVHGGGSDENLFLLDGTSLYQINHSLGLFSSFNTDLIKNVDFYKSGFPARYSGRLSSITDVRTRDGDLQQYHGSYSIGMLDGKFNLEGPLVKDKTSFIFGLRRSWIDFFLKPTFYIINHGDNDGDKTSFGYMFYDLNAKITHYFSDRNKISIGLYSGLDHYNINDKSVWNPYVEDTKNNFRWGNLNVALNWSFSIKNKLFGNFTGCFTHNHSMQDYSEDDTQKLKEGIVRRTSLDTQNNSSHIYDYGIKADFDYRPSVFHKINFGGSYYCHIFKPQTKQQAFYFGDSSEEVDTTKVESTNFNRANEFSFYVEDEMNVLKNLSMDIGLNYSFFAVKDKAYQHLDPRFALKYQLGNNCSAKLSYTFMSQYVHRIASTYLEMPTDYWVLTTSSILPATSTQIAAGLYVRPNNTLTLSLESFYKYTSHLIQYRDWMGLQPPASRWDKDVIDGCGRSYGIELDADYRTQRTTLQASYTLSWTLHKYNDFDAGWFRDKFDNRHKLDIVWRYKLSSNTAIYASWTYHSGNRMTLPSKYITLPTLPNESIGLTSQYFLGNPNNVGLPAYHRLDIGANFTHKTKRGNDRIWNISIYNLYCHLNTMYSKIHQNEDGSFSIKCRGYIPIIPSVSYTLKF